MERAFNTHTHILQVFWTT